MQSQILRNICFHFKFSGKAAMERECTCPRAAFNVLFFGTSSLCFFKVYFSFMSPSVDI